MFAQKKKLTLDFQQEPKVFSPQDSIDLIISQFHATDDKEKELFKIEQQIYEYLQNLGIQFKTDARLKEYNYQRQNLKYVKILSDVNKNAKISLIQQVSEQNFCESDNDSNNDEDFSHRIFSMPSRFINYKNTSSSVQLQFENQKDEKQINPLKTSDSIQSGLSCCSRSDTTAKDADSGILD